MPVCILRTYTTCSHRKDFVHQLLKILRKARVIQQTISATFKLDPNSKMNELKSLEHATLKVPYEVFNKRYRNAQRVFDVEARQVAGSTAEVDIATRKPPTSIGDFDMMLGGMVEKLTTMKRKATEAINEELQAAFTCKKRLDHLKEQAAALSEPNNPQTRSALSQWRKVRLERMLVDYCLRNGYYDSANKLTEARSLQELTNVDIYRSCAEVERGLALRRTARALQWCADNKSKLRKLNSTMEFNIRIQWWCDCARCSGGALRALQWWCTARAAVVVHCARCSGAPTTSPNCASSTAPWSSTYAYRSVPPADVAQWWCTARAAVVLRQQVQTAQAQQHHGVQHTHTGQCPRLMWRSGGALRALQWCSDNKSKLRKLNSTMEFNIRIQVSAPG
ncbi:hypothetical protein O0L34_g14073 [Tuta absoluta]|nr:hypothetical protein O0L34_g14073 [Tuta absoluta]